MTEPMSLSADSMAVGQTYRFLSEPVTTQQLVRYAGASGDYNPIHYDLPHAQSAGLGGIIAHGMLTMAFAGRCVTDWAGRSLRVMELGGRFLSPVRPGDRVEMRAEVEAIEGSSAQLGISGFVQDRQVFAGRAILVPHEPSAARHAARGSEELR